MEYIATDPEVDIRVVFDIQHSVQNQKFRMGKYGFTGKIEVRKFTNSFSGMQLNVAMEAQVNWLEFNLTTNFDGMKNGITKFKYEHVLGFNFAVAGLCSSYGFLSTVKIDNTKDLFRIVKQ